MYPRMYVYLKRIQENAEKLNSLCKEKGVKISGVTKVLCGEPKVAESMVKAGIEIIADSRIINIKKIKNSGVKAEFMLIRIPMHSEIEEAVKFCDYILVSEISSIELIDSYSKIYDKKLKIIYMVDVGDLREGVWYENAVQEIKKVLEYKNINLYGIGTNLGCFGGVLPSVENMNMLLEIKNTVEKNNNIKLELISGGNSAALPLIEGNNLPAGINHFRLGESIICGTDATNGRTVPGLRQDTIILEGEIVELKLKPSVPVGETGFDAFGNKPQFDDKGTRKKAILALGEQDIFTSGLYPIDEGIEVLHSSSDHTIVDVTDYKGDLKVGDKLLFKMSYGCTLKAATTPYIEKIYVE